MKNLLIFNNFINEKLGINPIVSQVTDFIYDKYLKNWKGETLSIDVDRLGKPFNRLKKLIIKKSECNKNHLWWVKIFEIQCTIYLKYNDDYKRGLHHELQHIYENSILNWKNFKKPIEGNTEDYLLNKSENGPIIASVYRSLLRSNIKNKEEFLNKLKTISYYKKYVDLVKNTNNKNIKKYSLRMIKNMYRLYSLIINNDSNEIQTTNINIKKNIKHTYFKIGDIIKCKNLSVIKNNYDNFKYQFIVSKKKFQVLEIINCDDIPECFERKGKGKGQFIYIGYKNSSNRKFYFPSDYFTLSD